MEKQIENQISYSQTRMAQEVMQMQFRFQNLCIKAEPISLLQVEVQSHGSIMKLEQCADVVIPEWNKFQMFIKNPDDLNAVSTAVLKAHPEFIKEVVPVAGYDGRANDENTLVFTMPEVNKARREYLLAEVEVAYQKTKVRLEQLKQGALSNISIALMDTPDDIKEAQEALDASCKSISSNMDNVKKAKDKEIEDAYAKYLEEHPEQTEADDTANGNPANDVTTSIELPEMEMPEVPEVPEIGTQDMELPKMPEMPEVPELPEMPEMPELKMPEMPDVQMPEVPSWKS